MHILILSNKVPYPPKDGGAIATLSLATALEKGGAKVTLLAINTPKHYCSEQQLPPELKQTLNIETVFVDTRLRPLKALANLFFSKLPYNAQRFVSKSFNYKLKTILSQNTFDIVQLEGLYLTPYIKTIRQHTNALISLRAHNVEHEIWERTVASTKRTPKRWYLQHIAKRLKRMEQEALQQVDLLVPISKKDEGALVELGCKAPRITIPFGINADDFIAHFTVKTNHTPQVFHLGGLDWQPNQDGIVWFIENCWPQVLQAIPNAKFTIAGRNAPQRLLNNLNGRGIEYIGEVDNAKQFIANAGIMIVPLRIGSGMRIKIVEGMALGKAIVSTTIGAEGIDYTNGQNILIANTPSAFAKSLIELLSNQELELKIGAAAKEFATQTFDIKVQAEKLLDFYNKSVIQINS